MADVRWGIVGAGDVVVRKSGPALAGVAGSTVRAVMRRSLADAERVARQLGAARAYDDVDALLHDPEIDAVYVATPPSSHCELTLRALATGRPVLVEKPMAMDAAEADRMVAAADRAGLPLFVAYYRRALPRFERLRQAARSGELGRVLGVVVHQTRPRHHRPNVDWKLDPTIAGAGLFVDAQSHALDWLDHAFGPPTDVQAMVRRLGEGPGEDLVAYTLGWADGMVASGLWCFGAASDEERVTVYGTDGTASLAFFRPGPIVLTRADGQREAIDLADPPDPHRFLVAQIVEHLRGGSPASCLGVDGARTQRLIDRLYADYRARTVA
jgi:predicted dehydrogenase